MVDAEENFALERPKKSSSTFQTDFLETFCKWYGNNYCLIITDRSAFQSFDAMTAVEMYRYFESYFKICIIF